MKKLQGLKAIEKPLASLPYAIGKHILDHIQKLTHYEPIIGIMGKTGAGKSSLCNALFQGEVTPVSDVDACTRDVLRLRLRSGEHSLILVDLPGVGESEQRDKEYESLYRNILPELDLILCSSGRHTRSARSYWLTRRGAGCHSGMLSGNSPLVRSGSGALLTLR